MQLNEVAAGVIEDSLYARLGLGRWLLEHYAELCQPLMLFMNILDKEHDFRKPCLIAGAPSLCHLCRAP